MDKLTILALVKEHDDLLSLPQALAEILNEVDNPDFGTDQLTKIILKDPSLTGRILKLANSATYRRGAAISNVHQAVQSLGAVTVKCLALSSSVLNPERIEAQSGLNPQRYFGNILTVAAAGEKIAGLISERLAEDAFVAGLLHDIGKLFFIHHYPTEYKKIICGGPNLNIIETELNLFGIDHCEVGYHLACRWHLPESIALAIRYHHLDADNEPKHRIAGITHLATLLPSENSLGHASDLEERLRAITQSCQALEIPKSEVDGVSISLLASTLAVAEYLEVDIGNYEEILARANQEIWRTYLMVENLFKERQDLSSKLLQQERVRGAMEAKGVAMATLSHYLNNIAMAIYGRSQMVRVQLDKGDDGGLRKVLPVSLDVIDTAIKKMVAVLAEMKDISPIDHTDFLSASKAMDMDDRIEKRMASMEGDGQLSLATPSKANA